MTSKVVTGLTTPTPMPEGTTVSYDGLNQDGTQHVSEDGGLSNGEIFLIATGVVVAGGVLVYLLKDSVWGCVLKLRRSRMQEVQRSGEGPEATVQEKAASVDELAFGMIINGNTGVNGELGGQDQQGKDELVISEALDLEAAASLPAPQGTMPLEAPAVKPPVEFVPCDDDEDEWTTEDEFTDCDSVLASEVISAGPEAKQ